MRTWASFLLLLNLLALSVEAAELRPPAQVTAGTQFSIASSGSGQATFYLIGPAGTSKRKVDPGGEILVQASEVQHAGRYTAVICAPDCTAADFFVKAADPAKLSLLVHPSRVPVADPNAISAVALVFDRFRNLVLSPQTVNFHVTSNDGTAISQARPTENGSAWIRMTSARKEGAVKIGASVSKTSEVRVVQQVAADACNLRIKGEWVQRRFFVETDPVRDCSGNNVPDGTVVSFTKTDARGKTTVDVPIKKGIAKVGMPVSGRAHITVASGVVTGNELSIAGAP